MADKNHIQARKLAVRVAENWGWLLLISSELNEDILKVLDEVFCIVRMPYKGFSLLYPVGVSSERREEIFQLANKDIEAERARGKRLPAQADVVQVYSER